MGERAPHSYQNWAIKNTQVPQDADPEDNGFSKASNLIYDCLKYVRPVALKLF